MHKTKIEALRKQFPEEDCFSALITVGLDSVIAGSPVIASTKPFSSSSGPTVISNNNNNKLTFARAISSTRDTSEPEEAERPQRLHHARGGYSRPRHKGKPKPTKIKKVSAKDLYEMGIDKGPVG